MQTTQMTFKLMALSLTFGLAACSGQMDQSLQSEINQKAGNTSSESSMASMEAMTATSTDIGNNPQVCIPEQGVIDAGTVSINGGAASTESPLAVLSLGGLPEILRMKISNDSACECGNWELYSDTKQWELIPVDGVATVGVQYKDYDGRVSKCVVTTIAFTPPTTTTTLPPVTTTTTLPVTTTTLPPETTTTTLPPVVTTTTTLPPVVTTTTLPPEVIPTTTTTLPPVIVTTTTTTTTTLPPTTTTTMAPTTTTTTLPDGNVMHQDFDVNASNKKVDILIVDDNSGSMNYEQKSMAKRMSTFLAQLKGLDWRVAITTTDARDTLLGDGRLIEMKGLSGQYFITSQMDANMAQKILGDTIQRKETGSSSEQGIYVTYRSLERSMAAAPTAAQCHSHKHRYHTHECGCHDQRAEKNPNKDFFRSDANLAVIVISDENESAKGFKNIPEHLLKFVKDNYPKKLFNFHSIITRPGDVQCLKGEGATYGVAYQVMSVLTGHGKKGGSIIGSVCEKDYGSQLSSISETCQNFQKMFQLKCAPVGNSTSSVKVQWNGSNYNGTYQVQGDRIIFDNYLPAGSYGLDYSCK